MTAVCGLLRLDASPADRGRLDAMNSAAVLLRPDDACATVHGPAALAERRRARPAAGAAAPLPRAGGDGSPVAVLDGRIDNREEILATLPQVPAGADDVDVLAAAYRAWGDGLLQRLVGEFALAVWDPLDRRLLCANDPAGIRRVYYWLRPRELVFASQLRQLLAGEEPPGLDDEYFGLFLLDGAPPLAATPYRGIRKLPPGHCLIAEDGRVRVERWWRPEELAPILYRDDDEYAAHFRDVFAQAVRAHLRADGPVWSELSGGLDSSSIVAVAQRLFRAGEAHDRGFATATMVFATTGPGDDPRYRQSLIERDGFTAHTITADESNVFADMPAGVAFWDEPHQQVRFYAFFRRYQRMLGEAGVSALLCGNGGEIPMLLEYPPPLHLADLLRRGRWRTAWREALIWQRALRLPLANVAWTWGVSPLLRPPNRSYAFEKPALPAWIEPAFARRLGLSRRANRAVMPPVFRSVGDQWQYEKLGRCGEALFRGYMEYGCEMRYPFLSRPVLEFGLAVPYRRLLTPGTFKPVLRRAMAGILPEVIRTRVDKGDIGRWVVRSLAAEWPVLEPLLRHSVLAELGYVRGEELHRAVHLFTYGKAERTGLLSAIVALEIWTRWALGAPPFASLRQPADRHAEVALA